MPIPSTRIFAHVAQIAGGSFLLGILTDFVVRDYLAVEIFRNKF